MKFLTQPLGIILILIVSTVIYDGFLRFKYALNLMNILDRDRRVKITYSSIILILGAIIIAGGIQSFIIQRGV